MKRKYDEFVDLHVAVVPQNHWNQQLNYASHKVLPSKISAGFIRVSRESTIHSLRREISKQIGLEKLYPDYIFLRNVAECLVLVHRKQEEILKAADFAPPTIEYPELLILPVREPNKPPSSQASNHPAVQRPDQDDSTHTSLNGSIAKESQTGPASRAKNHVHNDTSRNDSPSSESQRFPFPQTTTLHRSRHNVTSDVTGKPNNGFLEKLDPDGQSIARTIVRSRSSDSGSGIGRDSPHSSLTRRSPGEESIASGNWKSTAGRSNGSANTKALVPKYDAPIATDTYLSDLRDRQGSVFSSVRDDVTRKWENSHSSPSQASQNDASNHESSHSSTVACFIKSTVDQTGETNSPTQASPSPESVHSKFSVHSDDGQEQSDKDDHSQTDDQARVSVEQDFGLVVTGRTSHHEGHRIRSGNSSYEKRYPNEFPRHGSTTSIYRSRQRVTDGIGPIQANYAMEHAKPAEDMSSNIIPLPLIIRKSEQVNAVTYQSQNSTSGNSEDNDAVTNRNTPTPARETMRNDTSRNSMSNKSDPNTAAAITVQQQYVDSKTRYVQRDSRRIPSSRNDSTPFPTRGRSEESRRYSYSDDISDDPKFSPADVSNGSIADDQLSQLHVEKQNRQWPIADHSPILREDGETVQDYEEYKNSPTLDSASSYRSTHSPIHSWHNEPRNNPHLQVPHPPQSPPQDFDHNPPRKATPSLRSTEVTNSPLNDPDEIITNFISKANIPTPISKVGLQPISRGTPDGTHVSKRQHISRKSRRESIKSRSISRRDNEVPSNTPPYSHVDPRGGYVNHQARSDLFTPLRNPNVPTNRPTDDPSEIESLPSQGHASSLSDYHQAPEHIRTNNFRHESQTQREPDDDSHLRSALWQDLRKVREKRERLEEIRQVTIKEARLKAAMISRKRDGSQEIWKKRYHEEKKVTDSLTKFYQALESQCNNLNQKSKTIDNAPNVTRKRNTMRTTYTDGRPSLKKNSELQAKRIITQISEMKSRLAEVKAKLAAEIKVRHDVEQELKTMRKGLLSKKIQSNLAFRRINHYEELARAPKGIPHRRYRK